jgi:hypothetical protein
MVYHNNTAGVGGNKNKFSLLETIKNARNKKREKRQREMFCLETACTLMEASYQAYFPLPLSLPLSPPQPMPLPLSVPLSTSFTCPEGSMYVESSNKRGVEAVEENSLEAGVETEAPTGERKREDENTGGEKRKEGISVPLDAETDRHSLNNPSHHLLAAIASTTPPTQTSPSSSAHTDHSSSYTPHTPSIPPPIIQSPAVLLGTDEIPHSDPRSLLPPTDRPHTENRSYGSLHPSPSSSSPLPPSLPTSTLLPSSTPLPSSLSSLPSPILSLSDPMHCRGDDGTTHTAPTHQLYDTTSSASISVPGEQLKKEDRDEDKKAEFRDKEQKINVKAGSDSPVVPLNPPNPIGVDNRVLGPKMDLPRIGLRLLSSFENKEHATFGFVATTPLPPAFGPLKGKN